MFSRILFITLFALFARKTSALSDEHKAVIHADFLVKGAECLKEHPLSEEDINVFKEKKFPEGDNAPCFTACVLKSLGLISDKGEFTHTEVLEKVKEKFADDYEDTEKLFKSCTKVNEEEVTDGEKGCERAKLIYDCFTEHAEEFGFDF